MKRMSRVGPCAVDDCLRPIYALGWCEPHYARFRRHGSTDAIVVRHGGSDEDRLRAKFEVLSNGCWEWRASTNPEGYGVFRFQNRMTVAHKAAYVMLVGPIPDGLQLDHLCRNRACVNPSHLEPVTPKVNTRRGRRCKDPLPIPLLS